MALNALNGWRRRGDNTIVHICVDEDHELIGHVYVGSTRLRADGVVECNFCEATLPEHLAFVLKCDPEVGRIKPGYRIDLPPSSLPPLKRYGS